MLSFHKSLFLRGIAFLLAGMMILQGQYLFSQTSDPLADIFAKARSVYASGDYAGAKELLGSLLTELQNISGRDTFVGEANLLMGAACEKLQAKESAIKHYCLAKRLLGEGKSIEGIDLTGLPFYMEACPLPPPTTQEDTYELRFEEAKAEFFKENYDVAKTTLEKLVSDIASIQGRDTLKGEIYLLCGAVYETTKYRELSIKYFCMGKQVLGKGKSFKGLDLKKYKHYKANCPEPGSYAKVAKKKGGFGKFIGTLLGLAVLAVAGYFLYTKVINKPKIEKGKYTSISLNIDVTFKGLNSKGTRKLTIGSDIKLDESFSFTKNWTGPSDPTCEDEQVDKTYSTAITVTGDALDIRLEYINWDYLHFGASVNWKALCTNWNFTVTGYTYESGKSDPGSPGVQGTEQLTMNMNTDCTPKGQRIHDCVTNAQLTFTAPTTPARAMPKTYSVQQSKSERSS